MEKVILKPQPFVGASPALMVTCGHGEKSNIITIAWAGIANSVPPMLYVSVRKERHSYALIEETGEFVINTVNKELLPACKMCGMRSGRDIDKFAANYLTKAYNTLSTPYIKESPVSCECKVVKKIELGSHTMFVAEILSVIADGNILDSGRIDLTKSGVLGFYGGEYFDLGGKV